MKVIVFDLGGTLMQYVGMPHSWVEFYTKGFEAIRKVYQCNVSEADVEKSVQILSSMNPRINYREEEYMPENMFSKVLEHWNADLPIMECVRMFWQGLDLKAEIYPDTVPVLRKLREKGFVIATLTDLPSGFPDEFFKRDIAEIMEYFDFYVSSAVSGYRKPNCKGLQMISEKYGVPLTELVLVGDEEKDRQTAENAGCRFIWIDRKGTGKGDICSLNELLGELGDAEEEGFLDLAAQFRGVAAIEKMHEERYRALLHNVEAMEVFKKSGVTMWECRNCGHVVVGLEAPAVCPVCKHPQAYFEVRKENY